MRDNKVHKLLLNGLPDSLKRKPIFESWKPCLSFCCSKNFTGVIFLKNHDLSTFLTTILAVAAYLKQSPFIVVSFELKVPVTLGTLGLHLGNMKLIR